MEIEYRIIILAMHIFDFIAECIYKFEKFYKKFL